MKKLILFDIDGTLTKSPPTGRFSQALKNLHGLEVAAESERISGLTDKLTLELLLSDEGWEDEQIAAEMPVLIKELDRIHEESFEPGSIILLPGVKKLLAVLQRGDATLGLITGNIEPTAKTKLEAVGLFHYFTVGGFGSDPHTKRSELVEVAMKRSKSAPPQTIVIGDTPRDISAGKEAGVGKTVGVATGHSTVAELKDAEASAVFPDFSDTDAVAASLEF